MAETVVVNVTESTAIATVNVTPASVEGVTVNVPGGEGGGLITSDSITDATTLGKALLTAATQAEARSDLGLGTIATYAGNQDLATTDSPTFGGLTLAGNLNLQNNAAANVGYLDFNLAYGGGSAEGRLYWDPNDLTLSLGLSGGSVSQQIGQELMLPRARNNTGSQINNGQVVYVSSGTGSNPVISLATNADSSAHKALAVATENIANGSFGYCTVAGLVRDIDTSLWAPGTQVYLSTAGNLTSTEPTPPAHSVSIGYSIRQHATEGVLLVGIRHHHNLEELQTALGDNLFLYSSSNAVVGADASTALSLLGLSVGGDFFVVLGDALGTNKLYVQDSGAVTQASLDSDGKLTLNVPGSGGVSLDLNVSQIDNCSGLFMEDTSSMAWGGASITNSGASPNRGITLQVEGDGGIDLQAGAAGIYLGGNVTVGGELASSSPLVLRSSTNDDISLLPHGTGNVWVGTLEFDADMTVGVGQDGYALVYNNGTGHVELTAVGDALTSGTLGQFAATTSLQLAGVISDETGSGALVFATSPTLVTPALGTPASGNLTSCTGYEGTAVKSTGEAGGSKFLRENGDGSCSWISIPGGGDALTSNPLSQFAATTSLQLAGVISDETGTGSLVFATSPTLVTPLLGTPTSGTLSNCTGLPISTGVSGLGTNVATFLATPTSANLAGAVTDETGSGNLVFATSPTLVTPALGTPASGNLSNCTNYPVVKAISATFDGGGSAITADSQVIVHVPYGCTINEVTMLADQSGSAVVDVWKDSYANFPATNADSITASAVPTISTATKSQDSTLTGWTTSITAGDHLIFNVDSASTITWLQVCLKVTLT